MKKKVVKLQATKAEDVKREGVTFRALVQPLVDTTLRSLLVTPMSVKMSYEIMKVNEAVRKSHEQYEALRAGLVDKYGKKGPDGKVLVENERYVIENKEAFDKEFEELLSLTVEVPKIPMSYLASNPDVRLSPIQLQMLTATVVDPAL